MILRGRTYYLLAIATGLMLLLNQAVAQDAAIEPSEPMPTSALEEFLVLHKEFTNYRRDLRKRLGTVSEEAERRAILTEASDKSHTYVNDLVALGQSTLQAGNRSNEVIRFLLTVAFKSYENDDFERSARLSALLIEHNSPHSALHRVAGCSYLELGQCDEARRYLEQAKERNTLDVFSQAWLEKLDDWCALVAREAEFRSRDEEQDDLPRVKFETTRGDFIVELFEDDVPEAVASFMYLVQTKFYENLPFYRVARGFGALAGCPEGNGTGGPGYEVYVDIKNHRSHMQGTLSMLTTERWTCDSKFFITFKPTAVGKATRRYVVFGRIIEGLEVALRLNAADSRSPVSDLPPDRILKATVLRKRDHRYRPRTTQELANAKQKEGLALAAEGKVDEAIKIMEEGIVLSPEHFGLFVALGHFYGAIGQMERSLSCYRKAVSLDPTHVDTRLRLANTLLRMEDFGEAVHHLQQVVKDEPNHYQAYNNLGIALIRQGRFEDALVQFEMALRIKPDYESARQNRDQIRARLRSVTN